MTDIPARLASALADRYRLERELGQGGMATVFLAEDLKHDRKVAVKVLKPELAAVIGAERFVAEIKTTAALQHPHILPLFDSGTADGFLYYVMPFIDGETLRTKLDRETQLGIEEAVRLTTAVADALDYAHRHGVVHRDIKPENILLHDGRPMVADFGIALALSAAAGGRMTETGMSLGTPHYMSPEQATAEKEITARADVYSLGAVLYEMLTGNPPHTGASAQQIIMKIVTEDAAPVTRLRKAVPPNVAAAVATAIEKLPADRFATAAEFARALENPGYAATTAGAAHSARISPSRRPAVQYLPWALAAILAVVAAVLARPERPDPVARFRVMLDSTHQLFFTGQANPPRVAVSPDGAELVYVGVAESTGVVSIGNLGSTILGSGTSGFSMAGRSNALIHQRFSSAESRVLPGTEGAWAPQFAPDGERVAYVVNVADGLAIRIVSLSGGPPVTVLDSAVGGAVAWGPDDHLYFLHPTEPEVYRVSAAGGQPELVTRLQGPAGAAYDWPAILPNGKGIILTVGPRRTSTSPATSTGDRLSVQAFDLETGASRGAVTGAFGRYAPTGHLVYATPDRVLLAAPFDQGSLTFTGRPVAMLEGVDVRSEGITDLALSPTGTLVYTTQSFNAPETVSWVGGDGSVARVDPAWTRDWEFEGLALSPDGRRAAVGIETGSRGDVWIKQLDRGPLSRLTFEGDYNGSPTWTADGRFVTYVSLHKGSRAVRRVAADGSGGDSLLFELDREIHYAESSRDGHWLVVSVGGRSDDVLALRVGQDTLPQPVLAEAFDEFLPALSPDGRWLAYVSNESGRNEVYLRPFPDTRTGKWQLTTDGGTEPIWGAGGRQLFLRSLDRTAILGVDLARGPGSAAQRVVVRLPASDDFEGNPRNRLFDATADGRFLMVQRSNATDVSGDLVVVLNWFTELVAKVRQ
ncbi:MAG TPA: protein kinase [Gemmatimonadales bacterium]|nr:protein kinase [Gemmatimonadales bacterium]